jgi:methyl-accepting chemotaxis protein
MIKKLQNIKISKRLILIFSLVVFLYICSLGYNIFNLMHVNKMIENIYNIRLRSVDFLVEADRDAYQSSIAISQALNTRINSDDAKLKKYCTEISTNYKQIFERYDKFHALYIKSGSDPMLKKDSTFRKNYSTLGIYSSTIDSSLKNRNFAKAERVYYEKYVTCFEEMRNILNDYTDVSLEEAEKEYNGSKHSLSVIVINSFIIFFVILAIILVSTILLVRSIKKPLDSAVDATTKISQGNLVVEIDNVFEDEIGVLSKSLKIMVEKIREVIATVVTSSENFVASSRELSVSAQQISSGANSQAASSEEISSSIEEISSSINQTSENALQTEKIATLAAESIKKANDSVVRTIEAMRTIIQKISIIKEIAEKTDLLAVNAAIESARAGEYGKGFAVVASEVRKLAEHSQKAAKEIDDISISSVLTAEHSGKMLAEVIPQIQNTARLVQEISATSIEQNSGITQISQAIQQLSTVVQSNSALSEELASSSEEVSAQASLLLETISYFKITQKEVDVQSDMELEIEIKKLTELLATRKSRENNAKQSPKTEVRKNTEKLEPVVVETSKKGIKLDIEDPSDKGYDKF